MSLHVQHAQKRQLSVRTLRRQLAPGHSYIEHRHTAFLWSSGRKQSCTNRMCLSALLTYAVACFDGQLVREDLLTMLPPHRLAVASVHDLLLTCCASACF